MNTDNKLQDFLTKEQVNNLNGGWNKLNNNIRMSKFQQYLANKVEKGIITVEESAKMYHFLMDCLNRNKLQKVTDVNYNKVTGEIIDIPVLYFNKVSNNYSLRNNNTSTGNTKRSKKM